MNPSGKLVDTWAKSYNDYPSSETFNESSNYVNYTEAVSYTHLDVYKRQNLNWLKFELIDAPAAEHTLTVSYPTTVKLSIDGEEMGIRDSPYTE